MKIVFDKVAKFLLTEKRTKLSDFLSESGDFTGDKAVAHRPVYYI